MMYKGVVRVNIFLNNEWIGVYVDDRLPCFNKHLHYARNKNENNFWVALIEKAYAKYVLIILKINQLFSMLHVHFSRLNQVTATYSDNLRISAVKNEYRKTCMFASLFL